MDKELSITLLANAGILIDTGNYSFIIDGLYSDTGHMFSVLPEDIERDLIEGAGELGSVKYLLFTHLHPDHFDKYKTSLFIKKHKDCRVILPISEEDTETMDFLIENQPNIEPLDLEKGQTKRIGLDNETEITAFASGHLGDRYKDIINICYILEAGEKKILITGDADCSFDDFIPAAGYGRLDAIIVNPLFFQAKQGAEIIRELSPDRLIIYHIPSEENDPYNLRRMVQNQIRRYKDEDYTIMPLLCPMQMIVIG